MDKQQVIEQIKGLLNRYNSNITQHRANQYNETELRNDFINPFFELLGWDVINRKKLPQHLREVKPEASVMVNENGEMKKKKPDYSFRAGTETLFFLETKKPSVDIITNRDAAFQLRRYGWNGNLKISILTNFEYLSIYDCSIRPIENDDTSRGLIARYTAQDYLNRFDEIYNMLSWESVLNGTFNKYFDNITASIKKEPFDRYFLGQIKEWRNLLSQDIINNNVIEEDELNTLVQKILNRIIFLRVCEDRNLEAYESLKRITAYTQLKETFIKADSRYDSGLFSLIEDERITFSDNVILRIFQDLYYPNSSYEFSVVEPYIIGQIYELFLEEKVVIDQDKTIAAIKKPEAVASQGVVNTPKNVTDIIVKETLDPLFVGKVIADIEDIRVVDICCGSGNFLLSAYEYIINFYIEKFYKEDVDNAVCEGKIYLNNSDSKYSLAYEFRRKILQNNLYGVDIDNLAVEVTKFSLLLKLIENVYDDEINNFTQLHHIKILPNIDANIKNGNSLIDSHYIKFKPELVSNISLINKIKIFDWNREFLDKKFDAIIGNPPYIRVQNMVHYSPEEYEFYKNNESGYELSKSELMDKYYLFIERALSLLNENGIMGYIIPHKFMRIKTGRALRQYLSLGAHVRKIIHFGTLQVFEGRSTYTCMLFLTQHFNEIFQIGFVKNFNEFLYEHKLDFDYYSHTYLGSTPWIFLSNEIKAALNNSSKHCSTLDSYCDVFVGLQTSNDAIYIISKKKEDDEYIYFTDIDGNEQRTEKAILRKCIYDLSIAKYNPIEANCYIIFPYYIKDNKAMLYTQEEMAELYPECYRYLLTYKDLLDQRSIKNRTENNWYQFGRSQSIRKFSGNEHLIWSVLSTTSNYVYDNQSVAFTGGGNGPYYGLQMKPETKESILYIQAVLNHWLMEHLVKNKASTFRGDYYSHGKQFVEKLPIYRIDFNDDNESKIHDKIVEHVKNIMNLNIEKKRYLTREKHEILERIIDTEITYINDMINLLYGVSDNVEESVESD